MPDPACCSLRPTGGHLWRWEGCYPFISLSWHWVPVVLQTCHFILRLMLILFGQLMLTKLPTLNLLQFCFERNANPTRRGTQRGTSWIGLAVPPVHHSELRLFAYHIFPWPSTLITPSIKILRFNHFFRSSFPYESHKTYVRQTCLHFVFCCRGPSRELRRYFSSPKISYLTLGLCLLLTYCLVKMVWTIATSQG